MLRVALYGNGGRPGRALGRPGLSCSGGTAGPPSHALLLTGVPGIGKTTILRRLVESLAGWRIAGFYTEEIRAGGRRRGFRAACLDGSSCVIADVDLRVPHRVGAYGVDIPAIDALSASALAPHAEVALYVVDEIGKMECMSRGFVASVRGLLDSRKPLVGAIARHGGGFIAEVKRRPDVEVWQVTTANRDELADRLRARLLRA